MGFRSANRDDCDATNPNRRYRCIGNNVWVLESEAEEIGLGNREEVSIAFRTAQDPYEINCAEKYVFAEITNNTRLKQISQKVNSR